MDRPGVTPPAHAPSSGTPIPVSIVLPTRNGSRYLDGAIESVVAQTHKDWELIIVDDGSTDETPLIAARWATRDSRIRTVTLDPGRGLPGALNAGFDRARGELWTWTSDDNYYEPNALARMAECLDTDSTVDFVYSDYHTIDEAGTRSGTVTVGPASELPFRNIVGPCFLYRAELHAEIGGYDESVSLAEDYDFWLRAAQRFRLHPIHEPLYQYRLHAGSLTARHEDEIAQAARRVVERQMTGFTAEVQAGVRLRRALVDYRRGARGRARIGVLRVLARQPNILRDGRSRQIAVDCLLPRSVADAMRAAARRIRRRPGS